MSVEDRIAKEPRPRVVNGRTTKVVTQCGNLYVTVNNKDHHLFEVFAVLGKSGGCVQSQMSALTLTVTMGIRRGIPAQVYVEALKGVRCLNPSIDDGVPYLSCADAIAQVMEAEQALLVEEAEEMVEPAGNPPTPPSSTTREYVPPTAPYMSNDVQLEPASGGPFPGDI